MFTLVVNFLWKCAVFLLQIIHISCLIKQAGHWMSDLEFVQSVCLYVCLSQLYLSETSDESVAKFRKKQI